MVSFPPNGYYDPSDGLIYAVDWEHRTEDGFYWNSSIDPVTGEVKDISIIQFPDGTFLNHWSSALAPDGTIYITDEDELFTLELSTGEATLVGQFSYDDGTEDSTPIVPTEFYSFAFNPVDGLLYGNAYGQDGTRDHWYTINTDNAELTELSTTTGPNLGLYFDSSGVAWYQLDSQFEGNTGFASGTFDDLTVTQANRYPFSIGTGEELTYVYAESLVVVPAAAPAGGGTTAPSLAKTGSDATVIAVSSLGALLIAAGAVFMAYRRRVS